MAESSSKKRKRPSSGSSSSKKVTVGEANRSSSQQFKVTFVQDETACAPVVLSSPGLSTPGVSFNAYAKPLSRQQNENTPPRPTTHELLLHSSQHPRLDYTAAPISLDKHIAHYVAVCDPQTQELQIVPAYHLSLRSVLRSEYEPGTVTPRRPLWQQREELGRAFGTKKAKKAIADRTVNAITSTTATKAKPDEVQSAILTSIADSTATLPKQEDLDDALLASKPIPRPNLSARTVEDAYPLSTLLPASETSHLPIHDWQTRGRNDETLESGPLFTRTRFLFWAQSSDSDRLRALRYITLLLDFHSALSPSNRSGGRKIPKPDVLARKLASYPAAAVSSVRRRFLSSSPSSSTSASGSAGEMSKWHMDNFYTHVCAISLYIDGWETDTSDLKVDLRMENQELGAYFKELGCKVAPPTDAQREKRGLGKAQAAVTRFAKLKVPLELPKARAGRRR